MITETITPVTHDLGQFEVRRVLPSRQRTMVGPFIFVDEFGPGDLSGDGMSVRPHPHIKGRSTTATALAPLPRSAPVRSI